MCVIRYFTYGTHRYCCFTTRSVLLFFSFFPTMNYSTRQLGDLSCQSLSQRNSDVTRAKASPSGTLVAQIVNTRPRVYCVYRTHFSVLRSFLCIFIMRGCRRRAPPRVSNKNACKKKKLFSRDPEIRCCMANFLPRAAYTLAA